MEGIIRSERSKFSATKPTLFCLFCGSVDPGFV